MVITLTLSVRPTIALVTVQHSWTLLFALAPSTALVQSVQVTATGGGTVLADRPSGAA